MSNSFATPWTVAPQAPLSMVFPSLEFWSRLPVPPPGDLPDPGIKPVSPALAGIFFTPEAQGKHTKTTSNNKNQTKPKWCHEVLSVTKSWSNPSSPLQQRSWALWVEEHILEPTTPLQQSSTQNYWVENYHPMLGRVLVGKDAKQYH